MARGGGCARPAGFPAGAAARPSRGCPRRARAPRAALRSAELPRADACAVFQDFFFYSLVYDPQQKTLLADKGEIRVGNRYQADVSDLLQEGRARRPCHSARAASSLSGSPVRLTPAARPGPYGGGTRPRLPPAAPPPPAAAPQPVGGLDPQQAAEAGARGRGDRRPCVSSSRRPPPAAAAAWGRPVGLPVPKDAAPFAGPPPPRGCCHLPPRHPCLAVTCSAEAACGWQPCGRTVSPPHGGSPRRRSRTVPVCGRLPLRSRSRVGVGAWWPGPAAHTDRRGLSSWAPAPAGRGSASLAPICLRGSPDRLAAADRGSPP